MTRATEACLAREGAGTVFDPSVRPRPRPARKTAMSPFERVIRGNAHDPRGTIERERDVGTLYRIGRRRESPPSPPSEPVDRPPRLQIHMPRFDGGASGRSLPGPVASEQPCPDEPHRNSRAGVPQGCAAPIPAPRGRTMSASPRSFSRFQPLRAFAWIVDSGLRDSLNSSERRPRVVDCGEWTGAHERIRDEQ